jgi:hypothetical protein
MVKLTKCQSLATDGKRCLFPIIASGASKRMAVDHSVLPCWEFICQRPFDRPNVDINRLMLVERFLPAKHDGVEVDIWIHKDIWIHNVVQSAFRFSYASSRHMAAA